MNARAFSPTHSAPTMSALLAATPATIDTLIAALVTHMRHAPIPERAAIEEAITWARRVRAEMRRDPLLQGRS